MLNISVVNCCVDKYTDYHGCFWYHQVITKHKKYVITLDRINHTTHLPLGNVSGHKLYNWPICMFTHPMYHTISHYQALTQTRYIMWYMTAWINKNASDLWQQNRFVHKHVHLPLQHRYVIVAFNENTPVLILHIPHPTARCLLIWSGHGLEFDFYISGFTRFTLTPL